MRKYAIYGVLSVVLRERDRVRIYTNRIRHDVDTRRGKSDTAHICHLCRLQIEVEVISNGSDSGNIKNHRKTALMVYRPESFGKIDTEAFHI